MRKPPSPKPPSTPLPNPPILGDTRLPRPVREVLKKTTTLPQDKAEPILKQLKKIIVS
ncbi:MAG TPA: hypothetical protein PL157_15245 [Acidobacteriota bacterium]|nr:hypothetical protein [Acidobacteriota bacterium]HNH83723.1 hypothetical protein [Acidobacteriota bacterium]